MNPTSNKHTAQPLRQPGTPKNQGTHNATPHAQSRHSSIAELLSTPPQLGELSPDLDEPNAIHLSRNPSQSSQTSIRDWQDVRLVELVESAKLIFINSSISVEEAFNVLQKHNLTSLPVEEYEGDPNCLTFDYSDLNSYLMLVLGKLQPSEQAFSQAPYYRNHPEEVTENLRKAKRGEQVPVKFAIQVSPKNPFYKLPESHTLAEVVDILGSGVHRIAIYNEQQTKITGILSQRRLIKYFWENARRFSTLEPIFQKTIAELEIGETPVISVFGDEPLINALYKMAHEKISSVAVVDHSMNLLGNISVTDVQHVTKSSQSHELHNTCLHFVSVILGNRGIEDGKDSFPIFHVYPNTSLVRTIAKLVATKAHRLWLVNPPTNAGTPTTPVQPSVGKEVKEGRAGKLIGVISLTDILNVIARKHGKLHIDPTQARKQRRDSGSSSRSSSSLDQFRRSFSGASDLR